MFFNLSYKGYDSDGHLFHGEVLGLKAVITFQGTTVDEIEEAFRDSVDDYLEWCEKRGIDPEKCYSGRLSLRIPPELHAKIAVLASQKGKSINAYIVDKLSA